LKDLRNEICKADNLPIYLVASSATLNELTQFLPLTKEEISKINGFGKIKSEKYGPRFLELIKTYCDQFGLESLIHEKTVVQGKKEKKKDLKKEEKQEEEQAEKIDKKRVQPVPKEPRIPTRVESFELFKNGKTIAQIAAMRNLVPGTIENHLSHYITTGELDVHQLISEEKLNSILKVVGETGAQALTPIKEKMGDEISYSEIKTALAYHQWINRDTAENN
jgi:ATP-dependent DNA helicase RecQ